MFFSRTGLDRKRREGAFFLPAFPLVYIFFFLGSDLCIVAFLNHNDLFTTHCRVPRPIVKRIQSVLEGRWGGIVYLEYVAVSVE